MKKCLKWCVLLIIVAICLSVIGQLGQRDISPTQTWLTQSLLRSAWERSRISGRIVRPWPGADSWPIARLEAPHLKSEHIVLTHAENNMLAFAMEHLDNTVFPGEIGNSVLRVHPDVYFRFLQALRIGDILLLESLYNGEGYYQVSAIYIVGKTHIRLLEPSLNRKLTLISCYPCTQADEDSLRYVVIAEETKKVALLP